jgi:small subunit ribosomal protein S8
MNPIADTITRIRNAQAVSKKTVVLPYSKFAVDILEVLKSRGYIEDVIKRGRRAKRFIEVVLRYDEAGEPRISNVRLISKQSRRVYAGKDKLKSFKTGPGICVISTSKGVVASDEAERMKMGGEVICEVW